MENQIANISLGMAYEDRFEFLKQQAYSFRAKSPGFSLLSSAVEKMGLESMVNRALLIKEGQTTASVKAVLAASTISVGVDLIREVLPVYGELLHYIYRSQGPLGYMAYGADSRIESEFVYGPKAQKLFEGMSQCFNFRHVALPTIFLYGPPGTGKSSAGRVISEYEGTCYHQMSAQEFSNIREEDKKTMHDLGDHTILIIDELDKVENFDKHLPRFLSFLDKKQKDQLIILTSNKDPSTFPQALLRPGRVDVIEKIDFLGREEAEKLFKIKFKFLWEKAMAAYDEANGNPSSYQPACITAFCESVKRQCIIDIISNGEEMPKVTTRRVSFMDNFNGHKAHVKSKDKGAAPSSELLRRLFKLHNGPD